MNGSPEHHLLIDVLSRKAGVRNTPDGLVDDGHGHRGKYGCTEFWTCELGVVGDECFTCVSLCSVCVGTCVHTVCPRTWARTCTRVGVGLYVYVSGAIDPFLRSGCCLSERFLSELQQAQRKENPPHPAF